MTEQQRRLLSAKSSLSYLLYICLCRSFQGLLACQLQEKTMLVAKFHPALRQRKNMLLWKVNWAEQWGNTASENTYLNLKARKAREGSNSMRIFKARQNMLLFCLLTFKADPFPTCSPSLLCWATWNQNAFQLHQSRNALCPLSCKARPSNASDSRSPPVPLLCLWQWFLFFVRPPALQAAVRADVH